MWSSLNQSRIRHDKHAKKLRIVKFDEKRLEIRAHTWKFPVFRKPIPCSFGIIPCSTA